METDTEHSKHLTWKIIKAKITSMVTFHLIVRVTDNEIGGSYLVSFDVVKGKHSCLKNFEYDFSGLPEDKITEEVTERLTSDEVMVELLQDIEIKAGFVSVFGGIENDTTLEEICKENWTWVDPFSIITNASVADHRVF